MRFETTYRYGRAILVLGLLTSVFFYDVWLLDRVWFDSPGIHLYFPWRVDSHYSLFDIRTVWGPREGIPFHLYLVKTLFQSLSFPLWNPYLLGGMPFFATGHKQVLDLTNLIYFFVGLPKGMDLQIALQVLLSGFFMYVLAYRWTRDQTAALIGGVAFGFSCHVITKTFWAPNLGDVMWIPAALLCIDLATVSGKRRYFVFYGSTLALIFLGGSDTHVPATLLFLTIYFLVRLFSFWRVRRETHSSIGQILIFLLIAYGVFLGLSAIRLFPFVENILLSDRTMPRPVPEWVERGAEPFEILKVTVYSVLNLFAPVSNTIRFRADVRNSFFLGVSVILLVIPCLGRVGRGRGAFFLCMALVGLGIAGLADAAILGLIKIPGLSRLAYLLQSIASAPDRTAAFYVSSLPLLCSLAYVELRKDAQQERLRRWMIWGAVITAGLCSWLLMNQFQWFAVSENLSKYFSKYFAVAPPLFAALILTVGFVLRHWSRISQKTLGTLIVLILFGELMAGTRVIFSPGPREEFYPEMPSIHFLKKQEGLFRAAHLTRGPFLDLYSPILLASLLMPFEIQSMTGYENILPRRHHKLFSAMATPAGAKKPVFFYNYVELTPLSLYSPILDLFNVRYLLISVDFPDLVPDDRYQLVYSNEIRIYENRKSLPRAFVVHDAQVIQEESHIIRKMTSPGFAPEQLVILEDPEATQGFIPSEASRSSAPSQARILRYEPERVVVDVRMNGPGFLVLSDSNFPGWRVAIDGRPDRIFTANYLFRAVRLEGGRHRVEFHYAPGTFRFGLFITLATLILVLASLFMPDRR